MKLTQVNIAASKYITVFKDTEDATIKEEITESKYLEPQIKTDCVWVQSAKKIAFNTITGELLDGQYATQINGGHWVKIPDYKMIKIRSEYIKNDILSPAGEKEVETKSVLEAPDIGN